MGAISSTLRVVAIVPPKLAQIFNFKLRRAIAELKVLDARREHWPLAATLSDCGFIPVVSRLPTAPESACLRLPPIFAQPILPYRIAAT